MSNVPASTFPLKSIAKIVGSNIHSGRFVIAWTWFITGDIMAVAIMVISRNHWCCLNCPIAHITCRTSLPSSKREYTWTSSSWPRYLPMILPMDFMILINTLYDINLYIGHLKYLRTPLTLKYLYVRVF